jgi:hypothetical protein
MERFGSMHTYMPRHPGHAEYRSACFARCKPNAIGKARRKSPVCHRRPPEQMGQIPIFEKKRAGIITIGKGAVYFERYLAL